MVRRIIGLDSKKNITALNLIESIKEGMMERKESDILLQ